MTDRTDRIERALGVWAAKRWWTAGLEEQHAITELRAALDAPEEPRKDGCDCMAKGKWITSEGVHPHDCSRWAAKPVPEEPRAEACPVCNDEGSFIPPQKCPRCGRGGTGRKA